MRFWKRIFGKKTPESGKPLTPAPNIPPAGKSHPKDPSNTKTSLPEGLQRQETFDNRQVRVFVSSTFRDMQGARDYLVKYIAEKRPAPRGSGGRGKAPGSQGEEPVRRSCGKGELP